MSEGDRKALSRRAMLVFPSQSYRVDAFVEAARRVSVELLLATDLPASFARYGLPVHAVDFRDPEGSAAALAAACRGAEPHGVLATNEGSALVAAHLAARLGLPHASVEGARAARDKRRMREMLAAAGVPSPRHRVVEPEEGPDDVARDVRFPCVVKPPMLTGSQGVIRADGALELSGAIRRTRAILARHSSEASVDPSFHRLLVEDYLPGREVSVEAVMTRGDLLPIAIFDKPDDLVGPFFEETLYVTPSRLPRAVQDEILDVTARAARALGLTHGPIHAELRAPPGREGPHGREGGGPPAIVEIAARSIGGLCSRTVAHVAGPLEDLLIRHAVGLPVGARRPGAGKDDGAAGVMMMPIPRSGVLRGVSGVPEARAVPGVTEVTVAVQPGESIRALPEGASYLGFIFARGSTPEAVERSLRASFAALRFDLAPLLDTAF